MSVSGNSLLTERLAVLTVISPVTVTTTANNVTSAYVNRQNVTQTSTTGAVANTSGYFGRYLATFITGTNGTGSVTFTVLNASDTNGTNSAAIYTATFAATNGSNIEQPVNIYQGNVNTSLPYIALKVGVDSGTVVASALLQGGDGRYETATTYSIAKTPASI